MMYTFKEKKTPKRINNAWGRELIDEGMSFYVGKYTWLQCYDEIVEWLADNGSKGLLCVGDFGLGKTVICTQILTAMFDEWKWDYICVSAYEMSRKVDEVKKHEIIIIDDFGVEGESVVYGEHRHIFNEIVDFAERNGIMLILTSNLSVEEMQIKYGVRTVDRLKKITKAVVFEGKSLRESTKGEAKPSYAYGVRFDTEKEADDFAAEQERIRDGIEHGSITLFDEEARDAFEMMEALEESNGTAFKYGTEPND